MMSQLAFDLVGEALAEVSPDGLSTWKEKKKTPGAGGHRDKGSTSFAAIAATFVPTFTVALIYLCIFVIIRQWYRNIYAPRTYMSVVPEKDRTPSSSRSRFRWVKDYWSMDDKFILRHQSLDAYLYLRFFRTITLMCFVGCCITWPILIPINATGGGTASQLDRISFSNINGSKRLYAHAFVAWAFLGFIMILVARERLFVVGLRQAHLLSKSSASRLSSRVVLFLSIPPEAVKEENLHRVFGSEAQRSWLVSNLEKLEDLVQERSDKCSNLESAETKLARGANKRHLRLKSEGRSSDNADEAGSVEDLRPRHKSHTVIGKQVDTIKELRTIIPELASKIEKMRDSEKENQKHPKHTAAMFVLYNSQAAAHQAYQQIQHAQPLRMQPRFIGVQPKEVLWSNLTIHPSDRIFRGYLAIAFIVATIILWSIPIGFVAAISNINYLTDKVHFLRFVNDLPAPILGFLTGFVPPYLMSTFVSYVPIFFLYIAKLSGEATLPEATMTTQTWYFAFQVIQVFLVTTFSSGAAAVATRIVNKPASVPLLLANNLPKASNFYLSYFILQGTASAAQNILNYSDLGEYLVYTRFFDKTPRQQYNRYVRMKGMSWGKVYPKFTNMAVIAIAYSCIAPLVLGFATVGLYLFYLSYRYNLLYVIQTKVDTKGACYSMALQHMLTGVYLSEICLIGLFEARNATGPSIMIIVLLIVTIIYHLTFNRLVGPLEKFFPVSLFSEDETPLLAAEEGTVGDSDTDEPESRIQKLAHGRVPHPILDPIARFLEPQIFDSHQHLKPWIEDPSRGDEDYPKYTDDDLKTAYVNPAMTSKTPKLWLVRDEAGVSRQEVEECEKAGLSATDEGATLDSKNQIMWDHEDLENVPIFKKPTVSFI